MLSSLHIENIAVIKQTDIDLTAGFNVLTGETGAGKSILIDSIGLLLGARPSKDLIRSGETRATVSALFTDLGKPLSRLPASVEAAPDEDGCLYLTRTIEADGRAQTKLNGRTVPLSVQRELMPYLISIHGQSDNRILLSEAAQLDYLDSFAGNGALLEEYGRCYEEMEDCRRKMASLHRDEREKARTLELLRYQVNEIDAASLKDGEEEALEARREKVKNAEKIVKQSRLITKALYRSEKNMPAYELIRRAISALTSIEAYVPNAETYKNKLTEMTYELEEIGLSVEDIAESEYEDPDAELDRIETRLDLIGKLERKYGTDIGEILAFRDRAAEELAEIELSDEKLEEYRAAYTAFLLLGDYQDSRQRAELIYENAVDPAAMAEAQVGDLIVFGRYEQDGSRANGPEWIEWLVLDREDGRILVISRYALSSQAFNVTNSSVAWDHCSLRDFLNRRFLNDAFSAEEQEKILTVTVVAEQNPDFDTDCGEDTQDKLFVLSIGEADRYFDSDEARLCLPTPNTAAQGACVSETYEVDGQGTCWWWLRQPGRRNNLAACIDDNGALHPSGYENNLDDVGVRPAMWISLSS